MARSGFGVIAIGFCPIFSLVSVVLAGSWM